MLNPFENTAQYFPTPLQQFQYYDKYSRFDYGKSRRETWPETVDRAIQYLAELAPVFGPWLDSEGRQMILNTEALPSMRLLAMAGVPARRQNLSIYNCFRGTETFLTPQGAKRFIDCVDQAVTVKTINGWKPATVKYFGKQQINKVTFKHWNGGKAGSYLHDVFVTPSHSWLLLDGKVTQNLKIGDKLATFDQVEAEPTIAIRHGIVFGDGTINHNGKYDYGQIRLCGAKARYRELYFSEFGFSYPPSQKGDPTVYLGRDGAKLKQLPVNPSPEYASGFIKGLLLTDGCKTDGGNIRIDSQSIALVDWLKAYAPLAGYIILSHRIYDTPTNYGKRKAPLNQVMIGFGQRAINRVVAIEPVGVEDVYCVVEPDTHTFTLANGLITGNCSYCVIDDPQAWVEMLIISMAGCGVGFSVERKYIDKLPSVAAFNLDSTPEIRTVEDSSEGWAEALRIGLERWFSGYDIDFDYSQIRPAGAPLLTKGGRASGPEPLRNMLNTIRDIILLREGSRLRTIDAHDISCVVGEAAVQGGMRRTAMISLSDPDDQLMINAKTDNYPSYRWNANNSSAWPYSGVTDAQILKHFVEMDEGKNGERGIFSRQAAWNTMPVRRKEQWPGYGLDLPVEHHPQPGTNPCQPDFATVLTPEGIKTFADIDVGSVIWSGKQWTKVTAKAMTSTHSEIWLYLTDNGHFVGTKNHRVISGGKRVEVCEADVIDTAPLPISWIQTKNWPHAEFNYSCLSTSEPERIREKIFLGIEPVYDITVEAEEHTYWTGGLLVSNCAEIILRPNGLCNLSIAVARAGDRPQDLARKVKAAAIFGTIQSTATHFPGLRPQWTENAKAERLLGVDITGQLDCGLLKDSPRDTDPNFLARLRDISITENHAAAQMLGINPSLAVTCVKPSGNSSTLLDCAPGLHARHSRYYVRNVRVSAHSPVYKVLRAAGAPLNPENGQTADNATTWVCAFPCKAPDGALVKADVTALDQLAIWKANKLNWTEHNPSITVTYKPDELVSIVKWVADNREIVGGISFLPAFDANYEQMPYVEITQAEYEQRLAAFPKIDWSKITEYEDRDLTNAAQELACVGGACLI